MTYRVQNPYIVYAQGFLLLQMLIVVRNWATDYWFFYWFCDFSPLIFALCFFTRNIQAAKGLMYIGFFGQLVYTLSFISTNLWGAPFLWFEIPQTTHVFDAMITFVMHMSTFGVLLITLHEKPQKSSLVYAGAFLVGMFATVLIFTEPNLSPGYNYNYIYGNGRFGVTPFYTAFWIPLAYVVAVIPAYVVNLFAFSAWQSSHLTHHPHHHVFMT